MRVRTLVRSGFSAGALLSILVVSARAQDHGCAAVAHQETSAADEAYAHGRYEAAESLYVKALSDNPHDAALSAAMVRTLLHEGRVSDAAAQANRGIADNPTAAAALTAKAEVEYRKGQPWLALETLHTVEKQTTATREHICLAAGSCASTRCMHRSAGNCRRLTTSIPETRTSSGRGCTSFPRHMTLKA